MRWNKFFSDKKSIAIVIVICVTFAFLFWNFFHLSIQQKIFNANLERQKLIQIKKNILNYKNKYGDLDEYLENLEERCLLTNISLPEQMNQGEFINFLQRTAIENQIKIISLIPNEIQSVEESELKKLPIEIKIESNYIQLINFLKTIEESERLIQIKNVSIKGKDNGEKINCELKAEIFSLELKN